MFKENSFLWHASMDFYLAIYFETKNGENLSTTNDRHSSKKGQAAVYKNLKPTHDESVCSDAGILMPYSQLNVITGKYNLKRDVDVIDKDSCKIYDSWYEKE